MIACKCAQVVSAPVSRDDVPSAPRNYMRGCVEPAGEVMDRVWNLIDPGQAGTLKVKEWR